MSENTEEKPTEVVTEEVLAKVSKPAKLLQKEPPITVGRTVLYRQHADTDLHMAHVCKVWSVDCVNLDAIDGNGHHYVVPSASKGTGVGQWRYPTRSES